MWLGQSRWFPSTDFNPCNSPFKKFFHEKIKKNIEGCDIKDIRGVSCVWGAGEVCLEYQTLTHVHILVAKI